MDASRENRIKLERLRKKLEKGRLRRIDEAARNGDIHHIVFGDGAKAASKGWGLPYVQDKNLFCQEGMLDLLDIRPVFTALRMGEVRPSGFLYECVHCHENSVRMTPSGDGDWWFFCNMCHKSWNLHEQVSGTAGIPSRLVERWLVDYGVMSPENARAYSAVSMRRVAIMSHLAEGLGVPVDFEIPGEWGICPLKKTKELKDMFPGLMFKGAPCELHFRILRNLDNIPSRIEFLLMSKKTLSTREVIRLTPSDVLFHRVRWPELNGAEFLVTMSGSSSLMPVAMNMRGGIQIMKDPVLTHREKTKNYPETTGRSFTLLTTEDTEQGDVEDTLFLLDNPASGIFLVNEGWDPGSKPVPFGVHVAGLSNYESLLCCAASHALVSPERLLELCDAAAKIHGVDPDVAFEKLLIASTPNRAMIRGVRLMDCPGGIIEKKVDKRSGRLVSNFSMNIVNNLNEGMFEVEVGIGRDSFRLILSDLEIKNPMISYEKIVRKAIEMKLEFPRLFVLQDLSQK